MFLKQSTAVDVVLGPFVDDTDGKTTEEALTLSQGDLQLTKNGAAAGQKNEATSATHLYGGNYKVPLDATDTNTLGHLRLMCKESGALPIIRDFIVLPANVYDALVGGSDKLQVDTVEVGGTTQTAGDIPALVTTVDGVVDTIAVDVAGLDGEAMRGTDDAALASVCTEGRLAELDAANLPTDVGAVAIRAAVGLATANLDTQLADLPTVAEFEARTLAAGDYTVVGDLGVVQTGDSYARLGAPVGASISADIASISGGVAGPGALLVTITITDGSNPVDGVEVWISTDEAGTNVIAGTVYTDNYGEADFMLDAGTYYAWKKKAGYNFTNPESITVS